MPDSFNLFIGYQLYHIGLCSNRVGFEHATNRSMPHLIRHPGGDTGVRWVGHQEIFVGFYWEISVRITCAMRICSSIGVFL